MIERGAHRSNRARPEGKSGPRGSPDRSLGIESAGLSDFMRASHQAFAAPEMDNEWMLIQSLLSVVFDARYWRAGPDLGLCQLFDFFGILSSRLRCGSGSRARDSRSER